MSRNAKINTLLLLVVAALAVLPLALGLGDHKEEPFTGADAEAETAITELQPDYEPWFSPLYEPPSGEIESALFALQAALGAGVLAYYFGLRRGRRQGAARAGAAGTEAAGTQGVPAAAEADTKTGIGTGTGTGTDAGPGTRTGSDSGAGAASGVRAVDGRDA
ncbi:energy-coupling factor ABC transporter substrate-binding protein [Streptomyces venezuelae]|uniref:energy-coupling factor ABC transporter substrate-binding protein n=1 Tax=Streptomyces venezuelae TaxID=54571 RepID=UPI00123A655B|nr:energy-coupling factor ABC transporter substrate-binding protein [Streptomyces venezuelae]QES04478.1 energy-coupling factor ABC transporter substrate-binding protein [Streptomyces venezuelae]